MKLILLLVLIILPISINAQYSSPESITYDSLQKRYLISNTTSGTIVQRSQSGVVTGFSSGAVGALRGITIFGNKVYACSGQNLYGYDLNTGSQVSVTTITGGTSLNDITADSSYLYATDFATNNRRIIKVDPVSGNFWVYAVLPRQLNGIYCDKKRNRLLVISWGANASIYSVSLTDSTNIQTLLNTGYSNLDGISLDRNDHVYISSYAGGLIARYDINFTFAPFVVSSGHSSPADIYVNRITDTLAVPNAGNNTVSFIPLSIPTGIGNNEIIPEKYSLSQNYPNPFNPVTKITYSIPERADIKLTVYNSLGKAVQTLIKENQNSGTYEAVFDASHLSSGVYFYKLEAGDYVMTKKMVLIK